MIMNLKHTKSVITTLFLLLGNVTVQAQQPAASTVNPNFNWQQQQQAEGMYLKQLEAGRHLQAFGRNFYTGVVLEVVGTLAYVAGSSSTQNSGLRPLIYIGAGLSIAGFVFQLASFGHIGTAGRILATPSGFALPVPSRQRQRLESDY